MTEQKPQYQTTALVPLTETMQLGDVLAKSGFFSDSRQAAQAVVKILAGREIGVGPIAAMTGVNIIKGRVTLSANIMAAAIKRDPRYDYRIKRLDDDGCELAFYEGGQEVGVSKFDKADAKKAGLAGDNWTKYPRNMMFARAISNGAKWFTPDIFGGPVYTPDELGATVDGETGEMIDGEVLAGPAWPADVVDAGEDEPEPPTNGKTKWPERPWDAATVKRYVQTVKVPAYKGPADASDKQRKFALSCLAGISKDDAKRHSVTAYLFGKDSIKDLTGAECSAVIDWVAPDEEYNPHPHSIDEFERIVTARVKELGQGEMELPA